MTFEEWFTERFSNPDDDCYIFSKIAWNAAITSSLNVVDAVNKRNIDENDVLVYIHEDLKKLLTA